jgi:hypothetical protein
MNKKQYAFVGPLGRINRMFETEQSLDKIPQGVTQIHLTEEQHDLVLSLRKEGKQAGWKDNSVVEFVLP